MNKSFWLLAFAAALLADIAGIQLGNDWLQWVSKPLILPFLIIYFIVNVRSLHHPLIKWMYLALFFSWCGDVLLMFQQMEEFFFILGLSAFLLAHVFYILFFQYVRIREKIPGNGWYLLFLLIYYSVLMNKLSPYLGELTIPVRVYGLVICIMLLMAIHMRSLADRKAGWSMLTGAVFFVLSDSVLAINKFYHQFDAAGIVIMLTYGAAQYYIVKGAIEYLRSSNK